MKASIFPAFRSNKLKETKPKYMRDKDGWFQYKCQSCAADVPRRNRTVHTDEVQCGRC